MGAIEFRLNGKPASLDVEAGRKLLWVLRGELALTGTKFGCGEGLCGACTVVLDGEPARACQLTMDDVRGRQLETIEGLARGGELHPLQQQFVTHGALQCGYCTSGMLMSAYGLLRRNPHPTREQIVAGLDDNLCRCAAYHRILAAVEAAAAGK